MPSYKLTYFDLMARGEIIRLIFKLAEVDFEDERLTFEEWPQRKASAPSGQLPYLTIDGNKTLTQSKAIGRYLAREFGVAGKGNFDEAIVDAIVDCADDASQPLVPLFSLKDEDKKKEIKNKYENEQLPAYLKTLEKFLTQNNGGDGYFVGEKATWADLAILQLFHWLARPMLDFTLNLDDYPKLKAHKARMEALPQLAKYIQNRKDTMA